MNHDDPEKRIAELERQLAKPRSAGDPGANRYQISSDLIRNVAFSKPPWGKRGYNVDEVDAFLDRVETELTRRRQR